MLSMLSTKDLPGKIIIFINLQNLHLLLLVLEPMPFSITLCHNFLHQRMRV
jgi:hypothetical protein